MPTLGFFEKKNTLIIVGHLFMIPNLNALTKYFQLNW